jgi:ParB-like chromosome segregation protein Spo0J
MSKQYEVHPIAASLPEMSAVEYASFKDDIAANGPVVPIKLFEGKILDGRHRERACWDTGRQDDRTFEDFPGSWDEAVSYVASVNIQRRNLNESQKAMVAAELANLRRGRPGKNPSAEGNISQSMAAKAVGVSLPSVERAAKVLKHGIPEVQEMVRSGELSVSAGANIASQEKKAQRKIVTQGRGDRLASAASRLKAASTLRHAKSTHDCCLMCNADLPVNAETFVANARALAAALTKKGSKDYARYVLGMIEDFEETDVLEEYHNLEAAIVDLVTECPQSDDGLRSRFGISRDELKVATRKLVDYGWIEKKRTGIKKDNARGQTEALWYLTEKGRSEDYHFRVQERVQPATEAVH